LPDRPLPELRAFIEFQRTVGFVTAAFLFVTALAFDAPELAWFRAWVNMQSPPAGIEWVLRVMALLTAIGGVFIFRSAWKVRDPEDHPLLGLLLRRPESVVWVAALGGVEHRVNGVAVSRSRHLIVYTDARTTESMDVPDGRIDAILDELEAYLPHATFGFSPDRLAHWREDPASLRVAPAGGAPYRTPGGEQDRERTRPKVGPAPMGALLLLVLLGLRLALSADFHCAPASPRPTLQRR